MNSFELNKLLGAVLGTCLCALAIHLAAGAIFAPHAPAKPGYEIQVSQQPSAQKPGAPKAAPEQSIGTLLASADAKRGESDTAVCRTCHNFDKGGPNMIGPNLWGVVGRPRASVPGYDYSSAMKAKGGKWTFDELDKFLTNPQGYIPGTKMTFAGFSRARQRADVIAYLRTLSDHPLPLPAATPPAAAQQNQQAATRKPAAPKAQPDLRTLSDKPVPLPATKGASATQR